MSEPSPRPNYTRIAVLEHDLLGIQPEPSTAAALIIGLRGAGTCLTHQPVDTSTLDSAVRSGLCSRCGRTMILGDGGCWTIA